MSFGGGGGVGEGGREGGSCYMKWGICNHFIYREIWRNSPISMRHVVNFSPFFILYSAINYFLIAESAFFVVSPKL